ncbi:uncharacterized protein LOC107884591 isoform X2 [Acyrthosiphon pisum]|uniref:Voltage-gated calcium channel subunit alpha C-terminal domain-containing protein n=1 Tax=Acyrthosiphon pisum TaxID=7029 RepID=A0A8R2H8Q1_ACYPI|nr:uncharacterized protein LOC107884591 isoform X2 [Acyrthosiphon pisum]|eukprot:XP_016662506.1 PREDICTED: uncharacterized protein LOC107884591 isoform X2 [Acyrthosiphon pisum]
MRRRTGSLRRSFRKNYLQVSGRNVTKLSPSSSIEVDYLPGSYAKQRRDTKIQNGSVSLHRGYSYNHDWLNRSPETDDNISNFSGDNVYVPMRKRNTARLVYDQNNQRTVHLMHRASFHFKDSKEEMNGAMSLTRLSHSVPGSPIDDRLNSTEVIGSAESLVGRILAEQGLGKYCDEVFVQNTSKELREALNMTREEMDSAAHQLLAREQHGRPISFHEEDSNFV